LRSRTASQGLSVQTSTETLGDLIASVAEAESEDRQFLISQLDATEKDLLKLEELVEPQKNATKAEASKEVAKKAPPAPVAKADKKPAAVPEDPAQLMASLKLKTKGLMGKAALAPMLAMLKGMYEESKERIAQQNVREEKSKKWFATKEAEHKAKLAKIEGKFKNGTLSQEFRTNETRDETRYFDYWSRCRERQHRQFHTNLKIQHAMMMKTKKMIDVYDKALSSKPSDQAAAKQEMRQVAGGMPEVVLLQQTQQFVRESLEEVRKEKAEMLEASKEGPAW